MDPSGPSQPSVNEAYNVSGNAAEQNSAENQTASRRDAAAASINSAPVESRAQGDVSTGSGGQASSLGYGVRGSGGDDTSGEVSEPRVWQ